MTRPHTASAGTRRRTGEVSEREDRSEAAESIRNFLPDRTLAMEVLRVQFVLSDGAQSVEGHPATVAPERPRGGPLWQPHRRFRPPVRRRREHRWRWPRPAGTR